MSSIGLRRQFTVGWISTGTLITFSFREYWPPRGNSLNYINRIRSAINRSSSWCKFSSGGLSGHFMPLATDNFGVLLSLNALKQVWQTHILLLTDVKFVQCSLLLCAWKWVFFNIETLFLNHVWWQHVHTYKGPIAIFAWNSLIDSSIVLKSFWIVSWGDEVKYQCHVYIFY